jgi:coenzyme F420 hydrogenase subunit beta
LRREHAQRIKNMVPGHVWDLVKPYGILPKKEESKDVLF